MAMKSRIVLLILLLCFWSSGVSARETQKKTSTDSNLQKWVLPQITVIGIRPLSSLQTEAIKASELKFKIFSSLTSNPDFVIKCGYYAPLGTIIKHYYCDVGYMKKARSRDAYLYMTTGLFPRTDNQLAVEFADKTRALNKEMVSLAVKHPELATAMVRANELQQRYIEAREKRFKHSIFIGHPKPGKKGVNLNEIDIWETAFMQHRRGAMSDKIWERWDSWYRKLLHKKSYRALWKSTNHNKYTGEFIEYVNKIISGE